VAQKLLFAVDFSMYTEKLLGCAGELARLGLNEVVVLNVLQAKDYVDYGTEKNPEYVRELNEAEDNISRIAAGLREQGLRAATMLETGNPSEVIIEVAQEEDVRLIFMGANGKGFLERATIGSVSDRVLKNADRPVLIQQCRVTGGKDGYTCENVCESLFGNVLVASDFSDYGEQVKPLLMDLARTTCSPVTLLHVQEGKTNGAWGEADEDYKSRMEEEGGRLKVLSEDLGGICESYTTEIIKGSPATAILGYADEMNASLVLLGALGDRGFASGLLGSVTEKVVRGSDRPVLVLKKPL